jgi:hypothetical protein
MDRKRPLHAGTLCLALCTASGSPKSARILLRGAPFTTISAFPPPANSPAWVVFFERLRPFDIADANIDQVFGQNSGEGTPTARLSAKRPIEEGAPSITWLRQLMRFPDDRWQQVVLRGCDVRAWTD